MTLSLSRGIQLINVGVQSRRREKMTLERDVVSQVSVKSGFYCQNSCENYKRNKLFAVFVIDSK